MVPTLEMKEGQNVRIRHPGGHPKGPRGGPQPWPSKLPRQLEVVLGGSMSASRTSSTKGQKFGPLRGHVADSTVPDLIYENLWEHLRVANLFPDEICKNKTRV
uniref:Uncharacterized protein n=1 Tax=Solanum tuberosum TaxID=4113 RepID=M1DZ60_SOLTU